MSADLQIGAIPAPVVASLASSGCAWRHVPFTREGWSGAVPGDMVNTPLGEVTVAPETVEMPDVGLSLVGLIAPVLENPSYVVHRGGRVSFHRAVLGPDGEVRGYATVRLSPGKASVYVSDIPPDLEHISSASGGTLLADADPVGDAIFKALSLSPVALVGADHPELVLVTDYNLAQHLMGWGGDFFKADHGPIPADARWITVHPNGEGSKGVPVLVQPAKDNTGIFRVIGGAGGKLNMLKLRGVRSESEYKQEHAERAQQKRIAKKERIRKDKELGIHESKKAAREKVDAQRKKAQDEFVKSVAEAMGWDDSSLQVETDGLSPSAAKRAQSRHRADLLSRAKDVVEMQRRALLDDLDRQVASGLGDVPFAASDDQLTVSDLDPVRQSDDSGISPDFKARSEAAGLTQEKIDAELSSLQNGAQDSAGALERGKIAAQIRDELKKVPRPDLQASIVDAKKAVALLKAQKQLAAIEKQAREARADIEGSTVEPKAYVLSVSDVDDATVAQSLEDDLRTERASAFLSAVDEAGGEGDLSGHVNQGAYNAINAFTQSVGGGSMLDRSVVDVLGVAGTAQVLARRLHADYGKDEIGEISAGLAEYHVAHSPELQKQAIDQAKELQDAATQIEVGETTSSGGLRIAAEMNRQRLEHLGNARKVLGQALGEMEAHAAMVSALDGSPRDHVQVSLGKTSLESAIRQLWALGLDDNDYKLDRVEGNVFAVVGASGMDKLATPVDRESLAVVERNLSIMRGAEDEDGWLPDGFAKRPDIGLNLSPGVSPTLAVPFDAHAADLVASLRDYIGGRVADGDRAADILADVQSASFFQKVGSDRTAEYGAALKAVIPNSVDGKMVRVEDMTPVFDQYADDFVAEHWGGTRSTLNRQKFEADAVAQDALHRALSEEPAGVVAYKQIGELDKHDQSSLREWFYKNVAKESPEDAELRAKADKLAGNEPEKHITDMFGDMSVNPAWTDWKSDFDEASAKAAAAGLDWERYIKTMRSRPKAFEALQDLIRSRVSESFAKHYNTLRPESALKIGKTVVRNNLNFLGAVDPKEREARLATERSLIDSLRERIKGKYASGGVAEKMDAAKAQQVAFDQAQMGFFSAEELPDTVNVELKADERNTIGQAAEAQIAKMMGVVGKNFEPGKPVKLFQPSMSGPSGAKRQRMIKLIAANKRVIAGAGVGSGKTAIGLGAFSHLHAAGKVKKGLFVVPSIVQGQFGAEALRFLEAGKYNWHAQPGASFESRLAAYKDPETHFAVVTHQSFRDDLLKMAVMAGKGKSPEAVAGAMAGMSKADRKAFTKEVLDAHGIGWDYVMADEAHGLLNREGKENSRMSNVIEGVTDNAEYYVHASGDPVKNDASEAFSLLQKMDGERYSDEGAFMRRYGGDTKSAKEGLQRELARHLYAFSLKPDVSVAKQELSVPQSEAQQASLDAVEKHAAALRIANMTGTVDVEAAKALSPALFDGVPEDKHEEVARQVGKSVGVVKQTAVRRVLDTHPAAAKIAKVSELAAARKGQQGVVFAHSLEAVDRIREQLEKDGHRVVTISGKDSAADKDAKIRQFNPDHGAPEADIIVCSDAGATGANLQSGRWLVQYDSPMTAMTHAQRRGRIHRIGQKNNVELIDLVADHAVERVARKRLSQKYGLRDLLTSPLEGLDDTGLAYYLKQSGAGASALAG